MLWIRMYPQLVRVAGMTSREKETNVVNPDVSQTSEGGQNNFKRESDQCCESGCMPN